MSNNLVMAQEWANFAKVASMEFNSDHGSNPFDPTMPVAMSNDSGKLSTDQERTAKRIWNATLEFMESSNLLNAQQIGDRLVNTKSGYSFESLSNDITLADIGTDSIRMLCDHAGIKLVTKELEQEAVTTISHAILRAKHMSGIAGLNAHYAAGDRSKPQDYNFNGMYSGDTATDMLNITTVPSVEAFGANVDQLLSDSRMTIAVALLRFHKSCLNRIAHRRPRATIRVEYEIPYARFYSLLDSQNNDATVRNGREHQTIILDLYRNPVPVTQKLTPIVPKKANDYNNGVVRDGVLAVGVDTNLMTLAIDGNISGHDHTDWTDLVSDGVTMDKVYVTLSDGTDTETFAFDTGAERLLPLPQNRDASERLGTFNKQIKLYAGMKQISGADSVLLATLDEDDCIVASVKFYATCMLKNGDVSGSGTISLRAHAANKGVSVKAAALLTGVNAVKASIEGYSLNAFFSEENLRKSNIMFRTDKYARAYEIMCGANYMIDYSLSQQLEEYSMSMITEGMSIGMDDRAISMFEENARIVHARIQEEEHDDTHLTNHLHRINFDYVAGTRVNPWVYYDTIDLRKVDTIRSSDFMSDVRQYVDTRLTRILSLNHMNTLYTQQLEPGEAIVYKVVASRIVIENLFQPPHIHNNIAVLEDSKEADGQVIEFARKLTSGVTLHCVSLPWDRMRDKILIMPFRPKFPDSELNFCHNWDYGTFLAHYTPQTDKAVNKRIFMNARETPVITNPNIISLTVAYFDEVINLTRGK